ncbi:MAG TPA: methyltransferase [Terracidiphilus sp.]
MRATSIEFRLRLLILVVFVGLGYWAPWLGSGLAAGLNAAPAGSRISLLEWLALQVSRVGILPFAAATPAVIILASLLAALGAVLRVGGTAWMGSATVNSMRMHARQVVADGAYRYVRNPLYLGTWFTIAAISFTMPASGAAVCMVLVSVFLLRLVLAEESFLAAQLGAPYAAYVRDVPRLFPRLRPVFPPGKGAPHWGRALLAETNALGILFILAGLSWRYNNALMLRAVLINFGVSLVIRAFLPTAAAPATAAP